MTISGVKVKKADGTWGGGASKAPDVQDFTTSGTWTNPDDGWVLGICEMIGGGQGGARSAGKSGHGGAYFRFAFLPGQVGATVPVTVGAGGYAPGSSVITPGGVSQFGTFPFTASGALGVTNQFTGLFDGGTGGDVQQPGSPGGPAAANYGYLQAGDGGAGNPGITGLPGEDGHVPGGGGGSGRTAGGVSGDGGSGAAGAVRITLLYA